MEWLMRGNFTHVVAFAQVGNFVQVLDPIASRIEVQLRVHPLGCHQPLPADIVAIDFIAHGAEVVKISYPVDETLTSHDITNFFPGCVTICKGLLGVAEWVFTPWQFYQWLLGNGGEPLDKVRQDRILDQFEGCHLSEAERKNIFAILRKGPVMPKENKAAKEQQKRLKQEEEAATKEANKLKTENKRKSDALQRQLLGRTSLIKSGSELGVTQQLG